MAHSSDTDWLPGKYRQREKSIKDIDHELSSDQWLMQPKIDGVGTGVRLIAGQRPVIFTAEPKKTGPREHTEKVTAFARTRVPKTLDDTVVRAELFAVDEDGQAIPAEKIIGLVNATPERSLERQRALGVKLVPALIGVTRYQGKNVSNEAFSDQLKLMKKIQKKLPQFVIPETAESLDEKLDLLNRIKAKQHDMTSEGVVFHHKSRGKSLPFFSTTKAKIRPDFDVYVRDIFPGKGSREGTAAGGFEYSWTPKGPVVGRVGTGFSHTLVRQMHESPKDFIGRVAKVRSSGPFGKARGALRAPSFVEWHLEKGRQKSASYELGVRLAFEDLRMI